MTRYDTQATDLGDIPQADLIQKAHRMSHCMEPCLTKHLDLEQKDAITRDNKGARAVWLPLSAPW